jgi:hypothetical protein
VTGTLFEDKNEFIIEICSALLLVMVAIGVYLIVRACIIWGSYQVLLQEGDYTVDKKIENKRNEPIETIYWCAVVAGYLAWSFLTMQWHRTWIVWPIAGVGYGLLVAILRAVRSKG